MKENLNREELSTAISDTRKSFDTDNPIVPFIEGDGIGIDIWPASQKVFDSAVEKAYNNQRKIEWMEVLAGQKAYDNENEWLPEKTIDMFDKHGIGIKGPLTTPVGGGIRSINVTIRQKLDLYACVRPLRWFKGVETPTKNPGDVDIAYLGKIPKMFIQAKNWRWVLKKSEHYITFSILNLDGKLEKIAALELNQFPRLHQRD